MGTQISLMICPCCNGHDAIERPPSKICETCWKGLFMAHLGLLQKVHPSRGGDQTSGGFTYRTTWAEVASRASEGCRWCQLVYATKEEEEEPGPDSPLRIVVGSQGCLQNCTPKGTQDLSVFIDDTLHFIGYVYTTADDSAAQYIVARNRVLDVGTTKSLALAKQSLDECIYTHNSCPRPLALPPFLPTRLIDCSNVAHPRLIATDGTRGSYAALSYVWGEPQPHSTTVSNLETYLNFIDPEHLPQTILDAIHTTHEIGLDYLWADTLCIIQDSPEDKGRELSRMRLVYRDAHVTIIAASARRVSEGFLQERPAAPITGHSTFLRDITLPFLCPPEKGHSGEHVVGELRVSPIWTYTDPPGQPSVQYNPNMEPVNDRGWCMQEYFMSPRSLVFASHTLQFHCQTAVQNIGSAYHDEERRARLPDVLFLQDEDLQLIADLGGDEWQLREAWHMLVRDYTRRSITVPGDKLVALGGIAEDMHRIFRTQYLAGLWRDTLLADLLWSKRVRSDIPRPREYRAPSWSWAAVDGQVEAGAISVRSGKGLHLAHVVTCDITLKNAEIPYGEVIAGKLTLRSPVVACAWNLKTPNLLYRIDSLPDPAVITSTDDDEELEVAMEAIGIGYIDSDDDEGVKGVWAVPIHWSNNIVAGLIVDREHSQAPAAGGKRFRRIGCFNTHAAAGPVNWLRDVPLVNIEIV
ncbi:heterokaryon incompatibility protein-domain-containing protein [Dichomitus squalens]|uniref:Heterokaryon incompatibility protein-domain-containing protein n=1 Tax=Dichomitus squalens TaxID=114155 RepID=A0A4Q9MKU7_9APHY|nr:heterokaryon incompatibility protein-domain-containing protein [Dichomitus squalens]